MKIHVKVEILLGKKWRILLDYEMDHMLVPTPSILVTCTNS